MGYDTKTEITGHGFRAMARTILHQEIGIPPEVIEHQLAHRVPDSLGAAYNRTKFIKERRKMMQQSNGWGAGAARGSCFRDRFTRQWDGLAELRKSKNILELVEHCGFLRKTPLGL